MKALVTIMPLLSFVCMGASIVHTIDAPDTNISGLAWGDDVLWACDTTGTVYELNPQTGAIISQFYINQYEGTAPIAAGLAHQDDRLFMSSIPYFTSTISHVYIHSESGAFLGFTNLC